MTTKRRVFFSFDYDNDAMRVSQIKQMGIVEDGTTLVSSNEWEPIRRKGNIAIKKWIDDNMQYCSCIVVLIGANTHKSEWVDYEIIKALTDKKAIFGIYIHNLNCPRNGKTNQGLNPFDGKALSSLIKTYNPQDNCHLSAYDDIKNNLEKWIENAIVDR
jgi:hypothetical protein